MSVAKHDSDGEAGTRPVERILKRSLLMIRTLGKICISLSRLGILYPSSEKAYLKRSRMNSDALILTWIGSEPSLQNLLRQKWPGYLRLPYESPGTNP